MNEFLDVTTRRAANRTTACSGSQWPETNAVSRAVDGTMSTVFAAFGEDGPGFGERVDGGHSR
jgi:hypothetical protein